ncbi:MAG: helix-turn-helix transcriptional regulator [Anaerolineae bacterium]|nr:helix-turn-helix transcriptional regulator [Anaerolineae bacterium]
MTNISAQTCQSIAELLEIIGQPARMQILVVLSAQDSCVCHLEAALGLRQAAISQHLALLRRCGLASARRDGRHVYYRLADARALDVLRCAAEMLHLPPETLAPPPMPIPGCPCPFCRPDLAADQACKKSIPQTEKLHV